MPLTLEADVALVHIAGGDARLTPPPGTIAQAAPRRAARGRSDDLFFVSLILQDVGADSSGLADRLAHLAVETYFATPGSVTAAMREASASINDHLLDLNQVAGAGAPILGHVISAVLRGADLYMAQSGAGQGIVTRGGQAGHFSSAEARSRPLGTTVAPSVRFHHLEAHPDDLVLLTSWPELAWSDAVLGALSGSGAEQAVERLVAADSRDFSGILIRIAAPGQASVPLGSAETAAMPRPPQTSRARPARPRPTAPPKARPWDGALVRLGTAAGSGWKRLEPVIAAALGSLIRLVGRMAPGLVEPERPGNLTPAALIGTAVIIPLLIVAIASLVYLRRGRGEQFSDYLAQAQSAVVAAQLQGEGEPSRAQWEIAQHWIVEAQKYGDTAESRLLAGQIQQATDKLNLVIRLDFRPLFSGGLGPNADLSALASTGSDLYALDRAHNTVIHAWATGRGYELDGDFTCPGDAGAGDLSKAVDLAAQPEPGALGSAGVVAIDEKGKLLYCAPGTRPALGQLTPPEIGWGHIQAIDVFNDKLYVLDPPANSVWVYDASDGLFSGTPAYYFADSTPQLNGAIDLVMAQDQLMILFKDGHIDRCQRNLESPPGGGTRISVQCVNGMQFQDERPGFQPSDHLPGGSAQQMIYSPPPEPSLYFLDSASGSILQYSMRLVYQGQYQPQQLFETTPTAMTVGPPNDLFLSVGSQIYYAQPGR
jgi:hypothetical protein